jgi:hypothetical protein
MNMSVWTLMDSLALLYGGEICRGFLLSLLGSYVRRVTRDRSRATLIARPAGRMLRVRPWLDRCLHGQTAPSAPPVARFPLTAEVAPLPLRRPVAPPPTVRPSANLL